MIEKLESIDSYTNANSENNNSTVNENLKLDLEKHPHLQEVYNEFPEIILEILGEYVVHELLAEEEKKPVEKNNE